MPLAEEGKEKSVSIQKKTGWSSAPVRMEKFYRCVLDKNQFMKTKIFVAAAILAGSITFAQKKAEQPPPPPPPVVNINQVPPLPPPPKPPAKQNINLPEDYSSFLKPYSTIKDIGRSENKVRIYLKSGKEEVYDMNNESDVQKLKNKYGELPAPPPPPPPPKSSKKRSES